MGSLMAGWNSPVFMDPDTVRLERNKSLTKEEIDSFWKLQGKFNDEDHVPLSPSAFSKDSPREGSKKSNMWRSNSAPGPPEAPSPPESPVEIKIGDWWMMSKWAFLNEPPRDNMDDSAHKYTAQFDVAEIATN